MTSQELAHIMSELGLTQVELAKLINVSQGAVSRWRTGERAIPGPVAILIRLLSGAITLEEVRG